METNLEKLTGSTPLYQKYPNQSEAQDAYVEIHSDGEVFYESDSEIGNAVPVDVWHKRILRIAIPNHLTPQGYATLHESIREDIQTIIAGMDERWNGNNTVGTLTEEAEDAYERLQYMAMNGDFDHFDSDEQALAELYAEN